MSKQWRAERSRDYYHRMAKSLGFRSRAAFKLLEINKRFGILRRGYIVLDVGAYPGGWLQVASKAVGPTGLVIGIDLRPIKEMSAPNVKTIIGDICDESLHEKLASIIPRKVDAILSDASPKLTGVWSTDMARHAHIVYCVLKLAGKLLRKGGTAVMKVFQGKELDELLMDVRRLFSDVRLFKPKASRRRSREVYLICTGFYGDNDISKDVV
ncbi:MAG: RlmE family RNA methyltransferase [Candidatus Nezhaarchaeales archaeon]